MSKWIEIFKAGTHTDSHGQNHTVTVADLNKMATGYDPAKHEAPVVIGHPKTDDPAYAWVEALKVAGEKLFYKEKDVAPEFNEMRRQNRFKKRSISIYPDGTLKHIGWLGAMPPAIKGLRDVSFNEADDCVIYEFSEEENNMPTVEELQKKLDAEKAARVKAEGTASSYKEKLDSQTADFAEAGAKGKRKEIADFVEAQIKAGKMLPVWKGMGICDFMENIEGATKDGATLEFSEGENKNTVEPGQWFRKFISSFSEHPLFKDMAPPKSDSADFSEGEDFSGLTKFV